MLVIVRFVQHRRWSAVSYADASPNVATAEALSPAALATLADVDTIRRRSIRRRARHV